MKKFTVLMLCVFAALVLVSCATTSSGVQRVDTEKVYDITGYWNETDVQIVCEDIIRDCLNSPAFSKHRVMTGKDPVVKLGRIRNLSSEHIDTTIVANKLRNAIINSGKAEFVADNDSVGDIRNEQLQQNSYASYETAKAIANELGADFMVQGSIKTIIQKNGKTTVRQYYVNVELVDIESTRIVYTKENDSIKKVIVQPDSRW